MPLEKISSPQNSGVKRVMRLRSKKGRDAKNLTIVEGVREVRQALAAGFHFSAVYVCCEGVYRCPAEIIQELEVAKVRVFDTSCTVYDKIAYGDRIEGILALVKPPEISLSDLVLGSKPFLIVLERVEKPGNLGAILRTADAAGVDAVIDACDQVRAKTAMAAWALTSKTLFISVGAAGGKRLAHKVDIEDLSNTTHDPLLAQLRYRLRKEHGAAREGRKIGIACVFSREAVSPPDASCAIEGDGSLNCSGYGSLVSVTATFGQCAAGWVMNQISLPP